MEFTKEEDEQLYSLHNKLCDAINGLYHPKIVVTAIGAFLHASTQCVPRSERADYIDLLKHCIKSSFLLLEKELDNKFDLNDEDAEDET